MEIKITTSQILKALYVLSWIIFIGLCIEAGGILFNLFYTLLINPIGAQMFWKDVNLMSLYEYDKGYFITETLLMSIVAILQAVLFYLIVKILRNKKLNFTHPFNFEMKRFVSNVSNLAIGIGIFSHWGAQNTKRMVTKGVLMQDVDTLGLGGADVWLFMGITLFVIAQIFKRGVEIQTENDLTI